MKVVIQGVETCGIIADLAGEMARQGHDVTTIADPSPYFARKYDYPLDNFLEDYVVRSSGLTTVGRYGAKALQKFFRPTYDGISARMRERICLDSDLYVQVWSGWPGEYRLLEKLRDKGIKIATLFMGSEVRYYPRFQEQYGELDWEFPPRYSTSLEEKVKRIQMHEKYANAIFSVPDQMGLASRPYHHLAVPVRWGQIEFNVPDRDRPLVLHAPTSEGIKGSSVIEEALKQLRDEGIAFDYLPLKKIPNESLLKILTIADVLVDELILHGPGWLGFEAMAAGCAVATRYLTDSPASFRPPVWAVDRRNIKERLKVLLTDKAVRRELAVAGRRYVEENNGVDRAVQHILSRTAAGDSCADYFPRTGSV